MNNITLVCGRICSGKGSYSNDPTNRTATIIVSDLVRALVKSTSRNTLQETLHLDEQIALMIIDRIHKLISMDMWQRIIVDGIRQLSILNKVTEHFPDAHLVWIDVPAEIRKRRYEKRADGKDVEPFDIADNKPIELECQKIFDTLKEKFTIINNY